MPDRSRNIVVPTGIRSGRLGQEAGGALLAEVPVADIHGTVRLVALTLCAGLVTAAIVVWRSLV
ncbi:hypothetical protein E8L99_05680 [Phreatobacter aquaticus]|uniref:Uncharacterized protein n=1 Tax=Phreatobacter aquaticus TaxID=2570229 RepID=A0A4D7QM47_9HYPH|nr:hypothetical protein [Phreatobacter aquaticus]QCK85302.1 hypothetical protein E8L99_05680 [Phreatobacter aquaticus]